MKQLFLVVVIRLLTLLPLYALYLFLKNQGHLGILSEVISEVFTSTECTKQLREPLP